VFGGETSQSEWSEEDDDDDEGAASEPLLADRESTGYTTDDPALENISMLNETGLTDAEGRSGIPFHISQALILLSNLLKMSFLSLG
jgi:hypothetical protein